MYYASHSNLPLPAEPSVIIVKRRQLSKSLYRSKDLWRLPTPEEIKASRSKHTANTGQDSTPQLHCARFAIEIGTEDLISVNWQMPSLVPGDFEESSSSEKKRSSDNDLQNDALDVDQSDSASLTSTDKLSSGYKEVNSPTEIDIETARVSERQSSGDNNLLDQLQRSAKESENDTGNTDEDISSQRNEDTSMQDADSDGSGDVEDNAEGDQDSELKTPGSGSSDKKDDAQNNTDSSESSEEEVEFEASESSDDEAEDTDEDLCIFCKQSEENDPSEDFEPFLACTACTSHSHRQCARENAAAKEDEGLRIWRCPNCVRRPTPSESPKEVTARHRNSAPRLVRDLLPVSRGVQRPNSHSIFAQPLISEGEDGGRALRKRKSSTLDISPKSEKRRRKNASRPSSSRANDTISQYKAEGEQTAAHKARGTNQTRVRTARILQHRPFDKAPPHKFILAFRLEQDKIAKVLSKPPKPGKRRDRKRPPKIPPPPIFQPPVPKFPALPTSHLIFPSILTERENELNSKPYGGILTDPEADTSRSLPQLRDREIFEIARKEAEEERRKTSAIAEAEIEGDQTAMAKPNRTVSGPPSKIKCIQFGKFVIDTFYAAPYPEEYSHESRLFICEFCLKYLPSEFVAYRHKLKCPAKHPPGDEIYRDRSISIWEVDGRKKTEYCQCLCLMAKMFLGSKTLYYDVEPFLFYILTEYDEFGYHFVGYFSKEKRPTSQNNVSCILVMPIHQRKGYATFLIDFSYLLTRIEGKDGSPEKPLSDMGLTAYRSYWDLTISRHLLDMELKPFSTKALMTRTGMTADDVIHSLERLYAFTKDPVTKAYAIRFDRKLYENIVKEFESKKHRNLKSENLVWTPYIMGRSDQATLDSQPIQAIAPRDDEMDLDDLAENEESNSVNEKKSETESVYADVDFDAVSPRSKPKSTKAITGEQPEQNGSRQSNSPEQEDQALRNDLGVVAPGPPPTGSLTAAMSPEILKKESKINGLPNGDFDGEAAPEAEEARLTGYALAYRAHAIPPARFQIDPPIPPSMLRSRSVKKRNHGSAFRQQKMNGSADSVVVTAPVRSSPRNASSVNGSITGRGSSRAVSPDKGDASIRRSRRNGARSGLANVEVASLDGTKDEELDQSSSEDEELDSDDGTGDEIEAKFDEDEEEDEDNEEADEASSANTEVDEEDDSNDEDIAVVTEDSGTEDVNNADMDDEEADSVENKSSSGEDEDEAVSESAGIDAPEEEEDLDDSEEDEIPEGDSEEDDDGDAEEEEDDDDGDDEEDDAEN